MITIILTLIVLYTCYELMFDLHDEWLLLIPFVSLNPVKRFWGWTTQPRPRWQDCKIEAAVLFCVFGVTGSSSMFFVRPCLKTLGIEGSMMEGPWSYRILSVLIVSPIYATILMTLGTLSGRHAYFASMGIKILKRFLPSSVSSKLVPAKCKDLRPAAGTAPPLK